MYHIPETSYNLRSPYTIVIVEVYKCIEIPEAGFEPAMSPSEKEILSLSTSTARPLR